MGVSGRVIQIFEHDEIRVSQDSDGPGMTEADLGAITVFNDRNGGRYFRRTHRGIKATQFVGVLQVGSLTIEILPKADRSLSVLSCDEMKHRYKLLLLKMLKRSGLLDVDFSTESDLRLRRTTLLDIYIEFFLSEVEKLVRAGLGRGYVGEEGNRKAFKGRLLTSKDLAKNSVHRERSYTLVHEYRVDHLINRLISQALNVVGRVGISPLLQDGFMRVRMDFPELPAVRDVEGAFSRIAYTRKTIRYQQALKMAQFILSHFSPDVSAGPRNVLAFLFDMNLLWERFVYRELFRQQTRCGFKVSAQNGRRFWEDKLVRPDIVLRANGQCYVIDTKWKLIGEQGPSDSDLKQMFVYNNYFDTAHSILLYPATGDFQPKKGMYRRRLHGPPFGAEGSEHYCSLGFVRPFEEDTYGPELNKSLVAEILALLGANAEGGVGELSRIT